MARTPGGEALTEAHRAIQIRLATAVAADLAGLWAVDPTNIRGTLEPFAKAATVATLARRNESAGAARSYYAMFRAVEGVPGVFSVAKAPDPPGSVLRGGLFGAAARGMINARQRGLSVTQAAQNGLVQASGAAIQIAANGGRETILAAVAADPQAQGYQRVTDGDPCAFCQMVASRGIIAYSEDAAGFESHGHCGCTAEPAFEGSRVSARNAEFRDRWDAAVGSKSGSEALSAFRRSLRGEASAADLVGDPVQVAVDSAVQAVQADLPGFEFSGYRVDDSIDGLAHIVTDGEPIDGKAYDLVLSGRMVEDPAAAVRDAGARTRDKATDIVKDAERDIAAGRGGSYAQKDLDLWGPLARGETPYLVAEEAEDKLRAVIIHEAAHGAEFGGKGMYRAWRDATGDIDSDDWLKVSHYANENRHEGLAEAFAARLIGKRLPPKIDAALDAALAARKARVTNPPATG